MNMLGEQNIQNTLNTIIRDYKVILYEKYKYDLDDELSVAHVFKMFSEIYRKNSKQEKIARQNLIDTKLGVSGINEGDDILIINTTRSYPYGNYSILQRLRNGVPSWEVKRLLKEIYSEHIAEQIVEEMNKLEITSGVFQINISKNKQKQVSISPLYQDRDVEGSPADVIHSLIE
jgi:hypothetical protein